MICPSFIIFEKIKNIIFNPTLKKMPDHSIINMIPFFSLKQNSKKIFTGFARSCSIVCKILSTNMRAITTFVFMSFAGIIYSNIRCFFKTDSQNSFTDIGRFGVLRSLAISSSNHLIISCKTINTRLAETKL